MAAATRLARHGRAGRVTPSAPRVSFNGTQQGAAAMTQRLSERQPA